MRAQISLNNPDAVFVTMTVTMQLAEWKKLRARLDTSLSPNHDYVGISFDALLKAVIDKATQSFTEEVDKTT